MQADTFHLLQGESPPIESWDDDGDLQCFDDAQFHAISTTTSVTGSMLRSGHRDSISSRLSVRSDVESNAGDEDWQLLLRDNDETAIEEAIASARSAGIPIPDNVPKSALLSGSIKKLQSKQNKKSAIDDWSEDLEFPAADVELALKSNEQESFPESIQQIHTPLTTSPAKARDSADTSLFKGVENITPPSPNAKETIQGLGFHDVKQESQEVPPTTTTTSTVSQSNLPHTPSIGSYSPAVGVARDTDDDFEKDFEFPSHELTLSLKLSPPSSIPNTIPSINDDIWDIGWADGDGNGRFGGVKRDGRSTHSSSVSAFSPSASSCLTAETEDDGLDGLILPDGPFNFEDHLKKRKALRSDTEELSPKSQPVLNNSRNRTENDDFFDGLEIDDGSVFTSMKSNVNRNVKRKLDPRPMTPSRSEKTLTFTNKTSSVATRIPRLSGHNRSHTSLEPVSESGNPLIHFRRPQSRLTAHTNRSSAGSIHTSPPVTPSGGRRSLGERISREGMSSDLSSSHAQLLKSKRSAPAIRGPEESASAAPFQRPSSRQESASMIPSYSRPKTPVERSTTDSRLGNNRLQAPFLPAGASQSQSHHVSVKYSRHFRRSDSETSTDSTIGQKSTSRLSYPLRSDKSGRLHAHSASEGSNIMVKRPVTRPTRRRNYGDGTELESFDDLPTSALAESRYVKAPVGHGAPRSVRRVAQSPTATRIETPLPSMTSSAPSRPSSFTPRFARDTNASRIAREQRIASISLPTRNRDSAPLAPLSNNWKGQQTPRQTDSMLTARSKKGKASRPGGSRPHLIRPMGAEVSDARNVDGMQYNPNTCRWEGNENEYTDFDAINVPKSPKVAPGLITSVGTIKGAQVVGNMVFDSQRMCWLKLASTQPGADKVAVIHDDLEDVFAGLEDLQDKPGPKHRRNISEASVATDVFDDQSGDSSEEWPITEEFDVGPEFVKRQRAEEDRWRRKVTKWVTSERQKLGDGWRWAIRDLVPGGN